MVCLAFAVVLVFMGTLAQVDVGVYAAQAKYFRSFFVAVGSWTLPGTELRLPQVLPGGYLVGAVLLVNLVCAHAKRFAFTKRRLGLWLVHAGLILLLLGQLATDLFRVESSMRLTEGQTKSYSEDEQKNELAIVDATRPDYDEVVAIPESWLANRKEVRHPNLPFTVRVHRYWPNSVNVTAQTNPGAPLATQGAGQRVEFQEAPATGKAAGRDVPTAYIELLSPTGSLGTWAVSGWLDAPQAFTYSNRTYQMALRLARYYKPFSLQLLAFSHDKYTGTDIPRNFSSRLRLRRPDTGEDREVLVYMNNPLRYAGETFYQAGYDERDARATILQVVRNPGWLTPYVSCTLVGVGLVVQFLTHLAGFVRERRET
jgi:hypothetical protein